MLSSAFRTSYILLKTLRTARYVLRRSHLLFCCGGLICKQYSDERAAKYKSEILTCIVANAHFVGKNANRR
ncbi:hypothetical protein QTG54_012263 [Skeletonema marinoi]|uniref:Uncharacterized protein n=1 Tax=Skeletonema marinoi TaxID=267567 RepID=A0AAD8Y0C2_9STRA|nr:hypothetical protein QTG54_012260 [Skeletonema marinoi]KAK1736818.1 hypothetical protein QTG54_012263 [Skeletonema marinoi]